MAIGYTRDTVDPRQLLKSAQADRPGKPLRLRLQPSVLRRDAGGRTYYRALRGIAWIVDLASPQDVMALCHSLKHFLRWRQTPQPQPFAPRRRRGGGNSHHG